MITNIDTKLTEVKETIEKTSKDLEVETQKRTSEESKDEQYREKLVAEYNALKARNKELKDDLRQYEKCDPKKLEELKAKTKVCKDAANRWTDNLYEIESWMKKTNPGLSAEELAANFPILKDLDYPQ